MVRIELTEAEALKVINNLYNSASNYEERGLTFIAEEAYNLWQKVEDQYSEQVEDEDN
jgi:hypothetical protein